MISTSTDVEFDQKEGGAETKKKPSSISKMTIESCLTGFESTDID